MIVITHDHRSVGASHSLAGIPLTENIVPDGRPLSKRGRARNDSPLQPTQSQGAIPGSLGAIVGNFKSVSAQRINRIRHTPGLRVWQRNYYERVIRNERALPKVRRRSRMPQVSHAEGLA